MRETRYVLPTLAAACALALAACGGSPTAAPAKGGDASEATAAEQVYAEIAQLDGQERRDRLVELAQEEGELSIYTSLNADIADIVVAKFKETFDLDVALYRADSETILQRTLQEQSANFAGNDIVESNATEMAALSTEDVLAEYTGERRDMVNADTGQFDGWTASRYNLFSPGWNTTKVSGDLIPTSWEDLADPKYNGILSLEVGDYDWFMALTGYWLDQGKSQAEVDKLWTDMVDGSKVTKGHSGQVELLSAGEFAVIGASYTYLVEKGKRNGAPVEYSPMVEPVIARANGAGLMKNAKHPAAAMLFMDWYLEEGQVVLADSGLTPSIVEKDDPLEGVELIPVDVDKLLKEGADWSASYDKLLQGGEQLPDK